MLDIKTRVVTFAVNHQACYTSLKYCMEAWRINSGKYYERICFTIMLPENVDAECLRVCEQLSSSYPIELKRTSRETSHKYQNFWPLSFLEDDFDEDVIIYCPPHTLVTKDISWIIEKSFLDGAVLAPEYIDIEPPDKERGITPSQTECIENMTYGVMMLPMWFATFPKVSRHQFLNIFPLALAKSGLPVGSALTFRDVMAYMANAFTFVINERKVKHEVVGSCVVYELRGKQSLVSDKDTNFDEVIFFVITDAPENEHSWRGVFRDETTVRRFLEDSLLTGAWLYYQRNLRHVHFSTHKGAIFSRERNLFQATSSPYYIFALDFLQQSAGIRALHYLCHALNESGQEAYVTCKVTAPHLRTPILSNKAREQHQATGRTPIVVYPEIISGNPLAGGIVVRWMLNKPGHIAGDKYFQDDDLIFAYDPHYFPAGMRGEMLHIPTSDSTIFNNDNNPDDNARESVCFYAHKYLVYGGKLTEHVKSAISLCRDQRLTPSEIAGVLRRSKLLYVYEPTALIAEALLCGCPVSVIETEYWRNNTANYSYPADWGLVMDDSPESIALAKANVHNYRTFREDVVLKKAWEQIDRFVELTQREARKRAVQIKAELTDITPLRQPKFEGNGRYGLWRTARSECADLTCLADMLPDPLRPGNTFHLVVFVSDGISDLTSETRFSISRQTFPHSRLTYVAREPVPHDFELSERDAWSCVPDANCIEEVNRIVAEDNGSDLLIFLQAGDFLETHALRSIVQKFEKNSIWCMAFTDQDILQTDGKLDLPFFKPDFEPDMLRAAPFLADGMWVVRRSAFLELGGLSGTSYGAERFDLMLRIYENYGESGIGHISDVLCHQHVEGGHGTLIQVELSDSRRRVLHEHLARIGAAADIDDGVMPGTFHIRYRHSDADSVSIIIPTLNGGAMLQSSVNAIVENTEFKNWELIVVDQESDDADTLAFLDYLRDFNNDAIRVISQPRSDSFPALFNAGANAARQDYLLFLSDSTQPLRNDWLDEMLGYAVQPGVGVVGAKGVGPDGNVSNAGYILGLHGRPAGFHDLHAPLDDAGYFGRLQVPGNPSAVSFTCMLTKKRLFDALGGFDAQALASGYSDVDYCLKVGKLEQRVVWTPYALMFQKHVTEPPKTVEVDDDEEKNRTWVIPGPAGQAMFDRWLGRIAFDPAYNRNLSLSTASSAFDVKGFEIEIMPALSWDPEFHLLPRILAFTGGGESREEHRIISPLRALGNAAKVQGADTKHYLSIPELARVSPDVLIFQHRQEGYQPGLIESYARNSKAFRVFEVDVLLSDMQLYQDNGLANILGLSDRIVVPTEYLAYEYRKFNAEIHVVPDYIERAKWSAFTPKRRQGLKPRVGWAGSAIHERDLSIIADVVKALQDEVEWVFFGLCPEGARQLVEYHGGVVNSAYPSKLASLNLDLALSPLEDIPLNHAESHLRLLEYGMLGYPVICTDITPYRGAYPVTRVKNRTRDWVEAIREHVSDLDELARRGDVLRDFVREKWMLEDNLDSWLKAWLPSQA
ncbi:MAG: glycosyltransferase [Sulfurimicrobium sp.]|nr:glycosyltransferase [Sulfurimicrobium sp.]